MAASFSEKLRRKNTAIESSTVGIMMLFFMVKKLK
jgi:hypothetical protein